MCDRERLHELERENERFGWHDIDLETPTDGDLVIATDGEFRWMDRYQPFVGSMTFASPQGIRIATHWHYVFSLPEKFRKPPTVDPNEPKF